MGPEFLLNHINHQFEEERDIFLRDNEELQDEYIHVNVAISNVLVGEYFDNVDQFDAACGARGWRVWRDDPYRTEVRRMFRVGHRVMVQIPQAPELVAHSFPDGVNLLPGDTLTINYNVEERIIPVEDPQGGYIVPPHIADQIRNGDLPPTEFNVEGRRQPLGASVSRTAQGEHILIPCYLEEKELSESDWLDILDF